MHVCARVSVLKCWVCLTPMRTPPGRPAWCSWPPGSADPALESRWALLFFHNFWVKALKSSNSNWVLKLRDGRFWKQSPGPTMTPVCGSPGTTGSAWETHCQHSCLRPSQPTRVLLPPTDPCLQSPVQAEEVPPTLSRGRTLAPSPGQGWQRAWV